MATTAHRSPQKHLRHLVEVEKAKLIKLEDMELNPEQQARLDIVNRVEASSALEGYTPFPSSTFSHTLIRIGS